MNPCLEVFEGSEFGDGVDGGGADEGGCVFEEDLMLLLPEVAGVVCDTSDVRRSRDVVGGIHSQSL